jgi:GT2 family glycosyltransferase
VTPRISVVIVNYNSGAALESTLASLPAGLAGFEWDAVVVDNASADHSERAALKDDRVRLVRQPSNAGFAAGVNIGTAATSAPFVLVLNPDCRLAPEAGPVLLNELQNHPSCAVIGPAVLDPSGTLQESARGDPDMLTGAFGRTSFLSRVFPDSRPARRNLRSNALSSSTGMSQPVDWVSGACMLVRRDALAGVDGFDEGYFLYWEDADLCRRLRTAGWETRYMPGATAVHDVGQSSRNARALANREFHRSAYRYFATHVVPQWWHPGRAIGWLILMLRSRLKSFAR